jgi:divalent metal cation (Fe/Co/Zn/Cd) transporter
MSLDRVPSHPARLQTRFPAAKAMRPRSFSLPGLIVALLAIPIMALLARRKIAIATQLGSRAMRADAAESITCGWLSLVVVVGLLTDLMLGAWWVDAVTSLVIVGFVVNEAREAWSGEDCCDYN